LLAVDQNAVAIEDDHWLPRATDWRNAAHSSTQPARNKVDATGRRNRKSDRRHERKDMAQMSPRWPAGTLAVPGGANRR
jgi:hypothetical protein